MNSKLPVDVLGRIWELSDIDDDGFLDCDEFVLVSDAVFSHSSVYNVQFIHICVFLCHMLVLR